MEADITFYCMFICIDYLITDCKDTFAASTPLYSLIFVDVF